MSNHEHERRMAAQRKREWDSLTARLIAISDANKGVDCTQEESDILDELFKRHKEGK